MYILAIGYDSLRRRSKRCGSSLNSRNFQWAKGVYARPLIADGFLYDSCIVWLEPPHDDGRNTYFEIPEERVHKQVDHDERRENCIQDTHKDKTPSEPIHV